MQQHALELRSPHLLEHTGELWLEFIKRDVPGWNEIKLPKNPESWYDVYHKLLARAAKQVDKDAERMKQALMGLDDQKAKHKSKVVDAEKLRLPQEKPTSIQKYAFHDRKMGGIAPTFVRAGPSASSRGITPYDQTPQWKFEKPKIPPKGSQTTKKSSGFPFTSAKRNQRLCVPTHRLNNAASQVVRAPRSLIEDYKKPEPRPSDPKSKLPLSPAYSPRTSSTHKTTTTPTSATRKPTLPSPSKTAYASPPEETNRPPPRIPRLNLGNDPGSKPPPPPMLKRKRPAPEDLLLRKPKRTKPT